MIFTDRKPNTDYITKYIGKRRCLFFSTVNIGFIQYSQFEFSRSNSNHHHTHHKTLQSIVVTFTVWHFSTFTLQQIHSASLVYVYIGIVMKRENSLCFNIDFYFLLYPIIQPISSRMIGCVHRSRDFRSYCHTYWIDSVDTTPKFSPSYSIVNNTQF